MEITKLPLLKSEIKKRRVAAYARVSASTEELIHSLANQVSYYTQLIKNNPEWEFVEVYVDEGISGTSTEKRTQFLKMMDDARNGRFDLLLTKSVSRFARNTVDLLKYSRELKSLNIEVRFEKDNISTFSNEGELVLALLASFAQAESESISQNVTWSKQKEMREGIYHHINRCYGYKWDGDEYCIVEDEANVVRFIFESYINGISPTQISKLIQSKTVTGKSFTRGTVRDILRNSIYTGDRTLQKYYTPIVRRKKRNHGQLPKYVLEDAHEAIIDKDTFDKAQNIMKEKAERTPKKVFTCFSGKMICGHCGRSLCRRNISDYKIWKCQGNEISKYCTARYITEKRLRDYTFSIFKDEADFKRQIDKVLLFDDYLIYKTKEGKEYRVERKEPKKGCNVRKK